LYYHLSQLSTIAISVNIRLIVMYFLPSITHPYTKLLWLLLQSTGLLNTPSLPPLLRFTPVDDIIIFLLLLEYSFRTNTTPCCYKFNPPSHIKYGNSFPQFDGEFIPFPFAFLKGNIPYSFSPTVTTSRTNTAFAISYTSLKFLPLTKAMSLQSPTHDSAEVWLLLGRWRGWWQWCRLVLTMAENSKQR